MKLQYKIIYTFLKAILIPVIIFAGLGYYIFSQSFNEFLQNEQEMRFQDLQEIIKDYYVSRGGQIVAEDLKFISGEENINIELFDQNGLPIGAFFGLYSKSDPDQGKYVQRTLNLKENGQIIASLKIGYMDNSYLYPRAAEFRDTLIRSVFLSGMVAILAGISGSIILTRQLSNPILELSEMTKKIKDGLYDEVKGSRSDIKEIQDLSRNINYLANSLKIQESLRKGYAQDISHELRTPLTNLQLHLEAMKDGIIDISDENIDVLMDEIYRLNKLVDNLKISFNQGVESLSLNNITFDLSEEINNIIKIIHPKLIKNHIHLQSNIQENVVVTMDKEKLIQVIHNLLTNAIKAVDQGGIIHIGLQQFRDKLIITIRDNGVGISESDLPYIFDRFFRVDSSRNAKLGGYGLGLSITKNFVNTMGGKIMVTSKVNKGSEFIVEFPIDLSLTKKTNEKNIH